MTIKPEDFGPFTLSKGAHNSPKFGMCAMEMVSYLAGEKWSDAPLCSSPVVGSFVRVINDRMDQGFRDKLQAYVPRLIGTASTEHEQERAEYLAWQAIKVFAPIALDAAGRSDDAEKLRSFDKSLGLRAARDAAAAADAAYAAAYAADAAAYAAAYAADAAADAANAAAIFACLDGLLKIGPSGEAYTPQHIERFPDLVKAVSGEVVSC